MATLTLRTAKGSPLTNAELDANFTNILVAIGGTNISPYTLPTPTGTGNPVLSSSATLSTPIINNIKLGINQIATAAGMTTLTVNSNNQQRFTGTSTQTVVMPVTSTLVAGMTYAVENNSTGNITVTSSGGNLIATVIPGTTMDFTCIGTTLTTAADWDAETRAFATITGTGACVLATSPTLVTPVLGTPTSGTLTNCTGLPIAGITGLGTGIGTWLGTPSSANLASAITDETGTGSLVFATGPTITGTKETKVAMGAADINLATGNYFTKTISGATTLTVSNVPATGTAISFVLDLTNGGSATITWWTGVKWAAGTAPTLTSAGRDVLTFFTHDGGTTWSGFVIGKDVK